MQFSVLCKLIQHKKSYIHRYNNGYQNIEIDSWKYTQEIYAKLFIIAILHFIDEKLLNTHTLYERIAMKSMT